MYIQIYRSHIYKGITCGFYIVEAVLLVYKKKKVKLVSHCSLFLKGL